MPQPVSEKASSRSEFDDLPVFITVPHAARLLGLSRASAYRLAATGELPSRRLGGRVYVVVQQLRALVEQLDQTEADAR